MVFISMTLSFVAVIISVLSFIQSRKKNLNTSLLHLMERTQELSRVMTELIVKYEIHSADLRALVARWSKLPEYENSKKLAEEVNAVSKNIDASTQRMKEHRDKAQKVSFPPDVKLTEKMIHESLMAVEELMGQCRVSLEDLNGSQERLNSLREAITAAEQSND